MSAVVEEIISDVSSTLAVKNPITIFEQGLQPNHHRPLLLVYNRIDMDRPIDSILLYRSLIISGVWSLWSSSFCM